jgi:regulator of sigma E protease
VLVVLVLVHEFGHFIVAKRAGITVQEFGLASASDRLRGVARHAPLGQLDPARGFVKMLGEDGESEADKLRQRGLSEAVDKAMAGAFNRKAIWVRLAVLFAGVAMNFLLASVLFAVALSLPAQDGHGPLTITEVQADSPALTRGSGSEMSSPPPTDAPSRSPRSDRLRPIAGRPPRPAQPLSATEPRSPSR